MTILKDVLCLLAIFVAYGITGRMDYEDAMRMEQIRQERQYADCLPALQPCAREPLVRIDGQFVDPRTRLASRVLPKDGQPHPPRLPVRKLPC